MREPFEELDICSGGIIADAGDEVSLSQETEAFANVSSNFHTDGQNRLFLRKRFLRGIIVPKHAISQFDSHSSTRRLL